MHHDIRTCLFALLILLPAAAGNASATPAFARQTGADCRTCHFQNMHSLNRYGREFKMNSFHETKKMRERRQREAAKRGKDHD